MSLREAAAKACEQPTLLDALAWIAVCESERAIAQAREFDKTGVRTGASGGSWDTCFKVCFQAVMDAWPAALRI
jgi:hypothetical protein